MGDPERAPLTSSTGAKDLVVCLRKQKCLALESPTRGKFRLAQVCAQNGEVARSEAWPEDPWGIKVTGSAGASGLWEFRALLGC